MDGSLFSSHPSICRKRLESSNNVCVKRATKKGQICPRISAWTDLTPDIVIQNFLVQDKLFFSFLSDKEETLDYISEHLITEIFSA